MLSGLGAALERRQQPASIGVSGRCSPVLFRSNVLIRSRFISRTTWLSHSGYVPSVRSRSMLDGWASSCSLSRPAAHFRAIRKLTCRLTPTPKRVLPLRSILVLGTGYFCVRPQTMRSRPLILLLAILAVGAAILWLSANWKGRDMRSECSAQCFPRTGYVVSDQRRPPPA